MMVFRGCVKCQGDVYVEQELSDMDLVCLQCGFRRTVRHSAYGKMMQAADEQERELAAAAR
jgi:hypothetical protein